MRYDYRNDYKGWTKEKIENHLAYLREKLIENVGVCQSNANDYLKRITFLQSKL